MWTRLGRFVECPVAGESLVVGRPAGRDRRAIDWESRLGGCGVGHLQHVTPVGLNAAMGGGMSEIRIGTSGWSYDHWNTVLYESSVAPRDRLRRYTQEFDTVELNASFYRWPQQQMRRGWFSWK